MTQPRPRTPSTVSTTRELAPSSQNAVYSVMNRNDALHTISPRDLAVGRVSAVCHGVSLLASFASIRLATNRCASRVMRAIGFCHRLLQSRAPVPRSLPKRSRLPPAECFGPACGARLDEVSPCRADDRRALRFHDAEPALACRMVCDLFHRSNVEAFSSSASFAIGRASDAPVAPPAMRRLERSLSQRPTPENDAEIGRRRFREETAALRPSAPSVERCFFISTTSCDAAPRSHTGLGPLTASLLGSARFCRRVTGHSALSNRLDPTPLFQGDGGCRS